VRRWLLILLLLLLAGCPAARSSAPPPAAPVPGPAPQEAPGPPESGDAPPLRLATWNLRRLGHGKKRLDLAARLIEQQDVVALQEVMTPEGVDQLLGELPGWAAAVSPRPVGTVGYAEHYAVLYREELVELTEAFTVDDPDDRFVREPFVTCLRARQFDFCLVVIHVVFGSRVGPRDAEIQALAPLLAALDARSAERDWMIVGDFNRPATARGFATLAERGFVQTSEERLLPTSISRAGYRNDYDHLLLRPEHTGEWQRDCDRVEMVSLACGDDFGRCMADLSDHAPIAATFSTAGPDDD
jgi:endonuclease/exonuclease/phosphatase family metal-dependent hydrolase